MTDSNDQLITAARDYVADLFQQNNRPGLVFHTQEQAEEVVVVCHQMADYYRLPGEDRLVVSLAAVFHNAGFIKEGSEAPVERSAQIARQFLQSHSTSEVIMQRVSSSIAATGMPQSPVSLVEQILCDANLAYFARENFPEKSRQLLLEQEARTGRAINKREWRKLYIEFLRAHRYFTEYGQTYLQPGKEENLLALSRKNKAGETEKSKRLARHPYPELQQQQSDKRSMKEADKGAQSMLRITSHNHMELSSVADKKAHILITVNSIILSLLLHRLSVSQRFIIPSGILVLTCLISDTFSILATRPSISSGKFTEDDIRNKKTNLLFFGNFYQMSLSDYQWAMKQMMRDKGYLYGNMLMDTYYLGLVVAKKYRLLRIAYTVFMIGLIVSVLAFVVASVFYEGGGDEGGSDSASLFF